jgi:Uma2 family endonuclease
MATRRFNNAAEWVHGLGDVPLERIVFDPLPGTATEQDVLDLADHKDRLVELVGGTLIEKPPGFSEAVVATHLICAVSEFVRPRRLGVVTGGAGPIRMACGHVRLPSAVFVSVDDLPGGKIPREPIPTLPPRFAAEVLRAGNTKAEMRVKLKEYFESRTRLAWIVDPRERTVAVYDGPTEDPVRTLDKRCTLDGGGVFAGFTLPVADLFVQMP